MSTDQPAPPSIPPRKRPDGAPDLRASTSLPHVVAAGSASEAPAAPRPASPITHAPLSPAERAAAAMGASEPAPVAVPVTSTMLKALKSASAAVAGATAAVGEPFRSRAAASLPAGSPPRVDSTKAVPPIATTGIYTTATAAAAGPGASASAPRTAPASRDDRTPATNRDGAPRRVRLAVSRVDPWSVMKLSFLLSVAIGIMIVVAADVVWLVLDGLSVFTKVNEMVGEIVGKESSPDILQYVKFSRVVSGATFIAVIDVVLITALSTIGAFLYNITASLVGGVTLTLTDD